MIRFLIIVFALIISCSSFGQDFAALYELVRLGPNVNSRSHDSAPVITPDGNTLYFFRSNHPENKYGKDNSQDIWYCERDENGEWENAIHMESPLNKLRFNQVMSVSADGNTLLVRGGKSKKDPGLSLTRRAGGKWSDPTTLDIMEYTKMSKGVFSGACLSSDNRVLIMYFSEEKEAEWSDLYVSFLQSGNTYSKPLKLGAPINTNRDEFGPFLTDNMKTMYFASNRPGGIGGMDIYRSDRLDDSWLKWSKPTNLGPPVNTTGFDAYFSIDADGENAFTTRAFMTADGGSLDILGLIPIPNIMLSGSIINKDTNQPIEGGLDYIAIRADTGYTTSNESGYYETTLHKRALYSFQPYKEGFIGLADSIDFRNTKGDIEANHDFYLVPKKADVMVFGSVFETNSDFPLDAEVQYLFEGSVVATVKSESVQGYYSVKVPGQGKYSIAVSRDGYLNGIDSLLVQTEEDYIEIEKNLFLEPQILLTGYVMNEKDNSMMSIDVMYENNEGATGKFTSNEQGFYEVYLPSKGNYKFRGNKEGFINLSDSLEILTYNSKNGLVKDLYMIPIEVGITVRLNNIFFDFDKATLRNESFPELDRVVEFMQQNGSIQIEIGGHTDDKGSDDYNKTLSQGRAESVRSYIIEHGIDANRVIAKGYGESQPQVSNTTEEGRQTNRRVEFKVLGT